MNPEYESVEVFAEYLVDDERDSFSCSDLNALAVATKTSHHKIRVELEGYGFRLEQRQERLVRGFQSSSNDRYFGKGSERTHGGSGWEVIAGFASTKGFTK